MRKVDPIEIVAVAIPVLAELVAVVLFVSMVALLAGIRTGSI